MKYKDFVELVLVEKTKQSRLPSQKLQTNDWFIPEALLTMHKLVHYNVTLAIVMSSWEAPALSYRVRAKIIVTLDTHV